MDTLQTELNTHYPYLYGESNMPPINPDRNPQSVPFPQESFFGATQSQHHVMTQNSRVNTIDETYMTTQSMYTLIFLRIPRRMKQYVND